MSSTENLVRANVLITDTTDQVSPAISFGGAPYNGNTQTGIYGGFTSIGAAIQGTPVLSLDTNGLTLTNNVIIMIGATAPISGSSGTGDNFAGKGSFYIALDTGAWYQQVGAITAPSWSIIEAGNASVIAAVLTGFSAGAGTVSSADTILQAFNKLVGNTQNKAVTANLLTGLAAGSNTPIQATDSILVALANIQAQITALA